MFIWLFPVIFYNHVASENLLHMPCCMRVSVFEGISELAVLINIAKWPSICQWLKTTKVYFAHAACHSTC